MNLTVRTISTQKHGTAAVENRISQVFALLIKKDKMNIIRLT